MKKKLLVSLMMISMLLMSLPLTALAQSEKGTVYNDISGQWFTDAVTKYGYTEVFSDGSFKFNPTQNITRIEFVRLLHKALGITINYLVAPNVSDNFDDMKNTDVGANALIDLSTTGIIEKGGSFNPDKQLDRELMIHWTINALQYKTDGGYSIPKVKPVPFSDDTDISEAFKSEIYSAVVLKLVNGRGNNMMFPKYGTSRAEAVTVVSRLISLLESYQSAVNVTSSAYVNKGILTMSLTIQNDTDKTITLDYSSGQKYDFKLFDDEGNHVYTWSLDKMFILLMSSAELKPGESLVFSETLDSATNTAVKSAVQMKAYVVGTSNDFTINPDGYTATIEK